MPVCCKQDPEHGQFRIVVRKVRWQLAELMIDDGVEGRLDVTYQLKRTDADYCPEDRSRRSPWSLAGCQPGSG